MPTKKKTSKTSKAPVQKRNDMVERGEKSPRVLQLQEDLTVLGYSLPRWGCDGWMGSETMEAVEALYEDIERPFPYEVLPYTVLLDIHKLAEDKRAVHMESCYKLPLVHDVRDEADSKRRRRKNRIRTVDTIVLHQMAVRDSDWQGWDRWRRLAIHYVVTCGDNAACYWMHDPVWRLPHAQGFNGRSIGFECEGWFSGIGTDEKYFWKPKSRPKRKPMVPTEQQLEACRQGVRHAIFRTQQLGGQIKYIGAHRQSYGMKTSDPGDLIWRGVALPLIEEGLVKQFPGTIDHSRSPGKPIPEVWGGDAGEPYR